MISHLYHASTHHSNCNHTMLNVTPSLILTPSLLLTTYLCTLLQSHSWSHLADTNGTCEYCSNHTIDLIDDNGTACEYCNSRCQVSLPALLSTMSGYCSPTTQGHHGTALFVRGRDGLRETVLCSRLNTAAVVAGNRCWQRPFPYWLFLNFR